MGNIQSTRFSSRIPGIFGRFRASIFEIFRESARVRQSRSAISHAAVALVIARATGNRRRRVTGSGWLPVRGDSNVLVHQQPHVIVLVDESEVIALRQLGIDHVDTERAVQPDRRAVRAIARAIPCRSFGAAGDIGVAETRRNQTREQSEQQQPEDTCETLESGSRQCEERYGRRRARCGFVINIVKGTFAFGSLRR